MNGRFDKKGGVHTLRAREREGKDVGNKARECKHIHMYFIAFSYLSLSLYINKQISINSNLVLVNFQYIDLNKKKTRKCSIAIFTVLIEIECIDDSARPLFDCTTA